jgi:hypothetical protein
MPYDVSTFTLPCGVRATRADGYGVITKEDADLLMQKINPGGSHSGQPLFVSTTRMERMSPEARNVFSAPADPNVPPQWCAVLVSSPLLRVTVNFLLRVSRSKTVKMFGSEKEGLAWLDERVREDAATVGAAR